MKTLLSGLAVLALALTFAGCAAKPLRPTAAAGMVLAHDADPRVGTYVSSARGFETASYWIEGPTGLILIDTQFLLSATREAVDWAEKATGKKVALAIVLHPNPDKFNGTAYLQSRGVRVVTSEQVLRLIPEVHKDRHHWFYERFKPDYPNDEPRPESFGAKTAELTAGGVAVKAHVLPGPGCSESHVVVEYDGHVFVGDLVANLHHSWLEIGKTDEWLMRLDEIRGLEPKFVHPGRGPSGGDELLDREEAYLREVIQRVAATHPRRTGSRRADERAADAAMKKVKAALVERYPGYGNSYFLEIGLPAEWERQAK